MQLQPLVSVLMTAYNREKYIGEAIESVQASTYTRWELIITDDRSKDNTVDIARSYASNDNRIKVFINETNLGDYPNRNKAASYATGKYLKYVDADDYIYPWGLELLIQMMEKFPEAGWGLCSIDQVIQKPYPLLQTPKEAYICHYQQLGIFHKAPLSSIIKRDVFNAVGGFKPIKMAGDFEMWHRLAQKYPVVLMPHGIVWYREHGEQEMNSYYNYLAVYENIRVQYLKDKDCPLEASTALQLLKAYKRNTQKQIAKDIVRLRWQSAKRNIKNLQAYT